MTDRVEAENRRVNLELRAQFQAVFDFLRPYFERENPAESSHEHFAYRSLKEHFPSLSSQDCYVALATARRIHANGKRPV